MHLTNIITYKISTIAAMEVLTIINKRIILLFLCMIVLFCSCSKFSDGVTADEPLKPAGINLPTNSDVKLPANFTVEKIKNALLEYINYRLWFYPALKDDPSDKDFDNYIDKSIDVEIRLYNNAEMSVYCHTNIGNWLLVFTNKDDIIYCEGQVNSDEKYWPQNNDYQTIEQYSVVIPKPHKPNYGTSTKKNKMIDVVEAKVKSDCESFYKDDDSWKDVDVYIVDFYEYETGAHAWLCKQDGSIVSFPVVFVDENNEIKVQTVKTDEYNNKDSFGEFGRHLFERELNDAVKHFKWNVN